MEKFRESLSLRQLERVYRYTEQIINDLPPKAVQELMGGNEKDVSKLLFTIFEQVDGVLNMTKTLDTEKLEYLSSLEKSMDSSLKTLSYNYFKTTVLHNFTQGWRNLEWGNLIQLYPKSSYLCQRGSGKSYEMCYAFPLWRLCTYSRPNFFTPDTIDNKNRKETMIITNESTLGKAHLAKINEAIKYNDIIAEMVNPNGKADLNKESITTETGSSLKLRTYGSSGIRGNHIGACVVDDFLDKSALYSIEQRNKFKEVFYGEIVSIVEPGGYLLVSGTPFHEKDLYNDLKNDPTFKVFEYPGIFPDGRILAPDRYNFETIMNYKSSLGSLVFAREHLVSPISDGASLFPWEFLEKAFIGMETTSLVTNIDDYPTKMKRVVVGCDFAISGQIKADNSVFTVWGVDFMENYHLLSVTKLHGASHNEQINAIVSIDQRFKPNKIVCESNGFQSILSDMARQRGLKNIETFTTNSSNKKDLYMGLPSLSALFERGNIRMPYREGSTRDTINWVCGEFNSVAFNEDNGKLESTADHDDSVMSSFMAINDLRENKLSFKAYSV